MTENPDHKTFVLIDGKSIFYRGYYAMPSLTTKDGTPTGGVYGFAAMALELLRQIKPDYVAVAWDKPKTNIRRRLQIYDKYKAGRKPAPPDFYAQIPLLHELLDAFGWPLYELDDYEADDIMGTLSEQANAQGIHTIMVSSDLDMLQVIDHDTELYALKKGLANLEKFDDAGFEKKYGIHVNQFLDLKSLKGDTSDNIPGVAGIGEKTALALIQEFDSLDGVYANLDKIKPAWRAKLEAGKDSAYMSRELAKIWTDAPIQLDLKAVDVRNLDVHKLRLALERLEFTSLLRRLPEFMKEHDDNQTTFAPEKIPEAEVKELDETAKVLLQMSDEIAVVVTTCYPESSACHPESTNCHPESISGSNENEVVEDDTKSDWIPGQARNDESLLLSVTSDMAFQTDFATGAELIQGKKIITHDAKILAEKLLKNNQPVDFTVWFDTRQAAFLLNSLRKSPELADAINLTETDDEGNLRKLTDGEKIAATWTLYTKEKEDLAANAKLNKLAREVDFPLQIVIAKIEQRGVRLDVAELKKMSQDLAKKISHYESEIWAMVGYEFNVSSSPQLSDALFKKLMLPTVGIKKSVRGYFSTGKKELDKLRGQHPIIDKITDVREVLKLKNTYTDALPEMVDENSYLHTDFRQDVTATGRLSSSNPNLQNIPARTELGQRIRKAFIASEGKILVSADYSQFELRLAAALAGDTNLIEDFQDDSVDIHTKTAAEAYSVSFDDVTPEMRRHAKVINFGVLYGMSPHGLAAATGMPFAGAREFIDRYFKVRQPIRDYIDATIEKAKAEGYVETLFGRRRPTPDVNAGNFVIREAARRAAANMPMQGTEADLMKMAMLKVENEMGGICQQILQIHDSIMVECDPADAAKVGQEMKQIMENIYPNLGVRLKVDVKSGENWSEL